MERFSTRGEKRALAREDHEEEEEEKSAASSKRPKVPALASVIVEALKVDSLQRLCSSLEPLLRRVVSEEVERALTKLGQPKLPERYSPQRIEGGLGGGRKLQLHFRSRLPANLFTGGKVEGERGAPIHVVLLDAATGVAVPSGPESAAKLSVVVLEGDFNDEADDDWTEEQFGSFEVREREGKRPLLTGDLQVTLKGGVGTLGEMAFTDNSSWIRSRKFRLGAKVADGFCEGIRIREAKTEAFTVKDHRGELYKKHYPPALHDEVWRLDRIAKDGALHKKLLCSNIVSVEDFLRLLVRDQQKLRSILGSGMSNRMWDNTVEHAKTCVLGGKLYVYYSDGTRSTGAVFNHIYELQGLIANGQFQAVESLSHDQKISVDILIKRAYEDWNQVVEYCGQTLLDSTNRSQNQKPHSVPSITDYISPIEQYDMPPTHSLSLFSSDELALGGWPDTRDDQRLEDYFSEEEIRMRGSEMLEHDDMQNMLRSFSPGAGAGGLDNPREASSYSYAVTHFEPRSELGFGQGRSRGSAKAGVSWLKVKAAFRWGIFVRKKAAERRRAQLVELD